MGGDTRGLSSSRGCGTGELGTVRVAFPESNWGLGHASALTGCNLPTPRADLGSNWPIVAMEISASNDIHCLLAASDGFLL